MERYIALLFSNHIVIFVYKVISSNYKIADNLILDQEFKICL